MFNVLQSGNVNEANQFFEKRMKDGETSDGSIMIRRHWRKIHANKTGQAKKKINGRWSDRIWLAWYIQTNCITTFWQTLEYCNVICYITVRLEPHPGQALPDSMDSTSHILVALTPIFNHSLIMSASEWEQSITASLPHVTELAIVASISQTRKIANSNWGTLRGQSNLSQTIFFLHLNLLCHRLRCFYLRGLAWQRRLQYSHTSQTAIPLFLNSTSSL